MKMPRSRIAALIGGFLALIVLAGCGPVGSRAAGPAADLSGRKVRTVATTGMIADIVRNVGGDRVEVDALMGPGVDPHLYKASEGDVLRLGRADAIFYNGLHLEAKMAEVIEKMSDGRWPWRSGSSSGQVCFGRRAKAVRPVWFDARMDAGHRRSGTR
jgi:manganese/zinc/iron transport system substrate-binding protein